MKELPKIEEIIPEEVDQRRIYNLVVSAKMPNQATISLAGRDKEHATALAMEQMVSAGWVDCQVHDIYLMEDIHRRDREIMEKMMVIDSTAKEVLN